MIIHVFCEDCGQKGLAVPNARGLVWDTTGPRIVHSMPYFCEKHRSLQKKKSKKG